MEYIIWFFGFAMLTFLNSAGAPLSLFKFLIKSFLIRGFYKFSFSWSYQCWLMLLPTYVHLNVCFPMINEHKTLTNSSYFCLSSCSLRLNTTTFFALSTRSFIDFDNCAAIARLSLIHVSLFIFYSLLSKLALIFLACYLLIVFVESFSFTFQRSNIWL